MTDIAAKEGAVEAPAPAVSVVVSAYRSERTMGAFLETLYRQTFRDFETLIVDSSPDEGTAQATAAFPEVELVRSRSRLFPHDARNLGMAQARGELLAFFDPDVYLEPDCLEVLVASFRRQRQPISGAIDCHGHGWLDTGIHLTKFAKWLPGQPAGAVNVGPTANFLVSREMFDRVGGFRGGNMVMDAVFSWDLEKSGWEIRFEPAAVVAHHHLSSLRQFLNERYERGLVYAGTRLDWEGSGFGRRLALLVASACGLRMPRILWLVARSCRAAGRGGDFLRTLPLVVLGHQLGLWGEAVGYARRLRKG
ncbi:MAG: glycosyltransferase [Thermoanaerobaculia bacterium]